MATRSVLVVAFLLARPAFAGDDSFDRQVAPLLETRCLRCHHGDKAKGGLSLATRADLLRGGDSGPALVPGQPDESPLLDLIVGEPPDMPAEGAPLAAGEVAILRAWVAAGAPWPADRVLAERAPTDTSWWSLQPLRATAPPVVRQPGWPRNPLDSFLLARLEAHQLAPAPEADRPRLARRLSFDLLGLPPTPDEVAAFVRDPRPDAYERLVDRLLASPHYGQRWARHWLDVAHFAETHGHDQDRVREHAWPYRDYLVAAFNSDLPYARFILHQVAGDLLFPDDPQAVVALGFLAAGPWDESSLRDIREDTLDRQIGRYLDRDDVVTTVLGTFASTTVGCARCHDHKFDPIPQSDYYALQAVFAGVDRAARPYDPNPAVHALRRTLRHRLAAVDQGDRDYLLSPQVQSEVAAWAQALADHPVDWSPIEPEVFLSTAGATLTRQSDGSLSAGGPRPATDVYTITAPAPLPALTAVQLEVLADEALPQRGPGRQDNGNFHLSEFELLLFAPGAAQGQPVPFRAATSDFDQQDWTIAHAIDGQEKSAWGIFPQVGASHQAVFELADKLVVPPGSRLTFVLKQLHGGGHLIGRPRLSVTAAEPVRRAARVPAEIRRLAALPATERSLQDRLTLAAWHQRVELTRQLAALPPQQLVYAAAADFEPDAGHKPAGAPRPVHLLHRGDIRQPRELARPGALACVALLPSRFDVPDSAPESARRAALAHWLAHPQNPLTWRSIVNRVWHYHFGRGLVDTPNDFGRMGSTPSHPELLDWLALWFRDHGGSLKQLHRLIVTSAAYRQSTRYDAAAAARDADNRLLWRMPRARLDAESIRDAVLAVSGRLDQRMGGPSDRQFELRPGLHVTPVVDYAGFDVDALAGRRRSIYRFLFRTLPDPTMDALDCPAGDQLTPVRNASVTVQQALAMWNSAFLTRHAQHLADRLTAHSADLPQQLDRLYQLLLARSPTSAEAALLSDFARQHGLANACRLLLNSNEFLFVD